MTGIPTLMIVFCSALQPSVAQPDTLPSESSSVGSDKGHWLGVRGGSRTGQDGLSNSWIFAAGYEGRFSDNWSIPIEAQWFRDTEKPDGESRTLFTVSAALKLRIPLHRETTNFYIQVGAGPIFLGLVSHVALGAEFGLVDRISLYSQVKLYNLGPDLPDAFVTIGLNINVTSERLRQQYHDHE